MIYSDFFLFLVLRPISRNVANVIDILMLNSPKTTVSKLNALNRIPM